MVDIKPIYLSKYYLFQNKLYYLDKINFCFAIIKLFKDTIKKESLAQMFSCEFCEIAKNTFFTKLLRATASKQVTVPLQCLQTAKSLISSCRRTGETILSNYWQNPKITATVHYFHYNSHHYHYYHFHYHCKMHLYRLKILLTILFIVIWSLVCFNWILSSFYRYAFSFIILYFSIFLDPVKGVRISLRPSDIFKIISLYL